MEKSEFIEEDFISALNAVLSHFSIKNLRIDRISQAEEAKKGYDGTLKLRKLIYIQFKRSDYYFGNGKSKIEKGREQLGFFNNRGFFSFKLLKKGNGPLCYNQHNQLWNLGRNNDAFYCAPLFYKKKDLSKFNFTFYPNLPKREKLEIHENNIMPFCFSPQFMIDNTIFIKPHKEITDTQPHSYSYDKSRKIVFHSDCEKANFGIKLSQYINTISKLLEMKKIEFKKIDFISIYNSLREYSYNFIEDIPTELLIYFNYLYGTNYSISDFNNLLNKMDTFELGSILEYFLKDNFNIYQYGLFSEKTNAGKTDNMHYI